MNANVIANVYETYDYGSFKRMEGNRKLTLSRLNKLVASFRGGRILCPITVNDKMEIVDGQGRYDTCKALGLPVHFVVDPDATIDDCRRMNRYNTNWTKADFLHSYAEMGNVNYIIFEKAYEKTKLSVSGLLRIAHKLNGNKEAIEKGVLEFTKDDSEKAFKIDAFIKNFKETMLLSSVTGTLESALIIAGAGTEQTYTDDDLWVLSHIINAEAGDSNCPHDLRIAVGSVVLNRVASDEFPDTIRDVVYQSGQYAPTWNGAMEKEPSEDSVEVAQMLLEEGSQIPGDCVFQAEFPQGSGVYESFDTIYGTTYICYR